MYVGLFASANGERSDKAAAFEYFSYESTVPSRDAWYYRQLAGRDQL